MYQFVGTPKFRTDNKHVLWFITGRNGNYITRYSGSTIALYVIPKELPTELDVDLEVQTTELVTTLKVSPTELTTELGQGWDVYDGTCMPHGKYMRSHDTHNDSCIAQ